MTVVHRVTAIYRAVIYRIRIWLLTGSTVVSHKLIINANTSLQSGWDRDSQAKKGGMAGLTGKNGRESGIREAYWGPSLEAVRKFGFTSV